MYEADFDPTVYPTDTDDDDDDDDVSADSAPPGRWRGCGCLFGIAATLALLALGVSELRNSRFQAWYFSRAAADFGFELAPGPSESTRFPTDGPYDIRLGYSLIPSLSTRLDSLGFDLTHQARMSEALVDAIDRGAHAVYAAKSSAGLMVQGRRGLPIVRERHPTRTYPSFDDIPSPLWQTLLYIESQDFLDPLRPQRNPAVEWDRFALAVSQLAVRAIGVDRSVPGGSTLATQIEKFRHSPGGLTRSPADKLRQMYSASLRAYRDGPFTYEARRQVVTDYLNSVPLAAQVDHGEVVGTADGLWAWFGTAFDEANRVLGSEPVDSIGRREMGRVYRQALSLLIAHRRPSYHLTTPAGRASLADLADAYLGLMVRDLVIPRWLADEARRARDEVVVLDRAPPRPSVSFTERKATNLVRSSLLALTGVRSFYELDRLDLVAEANLDLAWHNATTELLRSMRSDAFLDRNGFREERILATGDPARVLYSVLLLERTDQGNVVRIQTDNFDGPMSLANASRLELGSTAKLRTLVTYLEIVDELHRELSGLDADALRAVPVSTQDALRRWAIGYLLAHPTASKPDMLDAALERSYSASPGERFVTGGGTQTFSNFDREYDGRVMSVREAFRHSVNLPFVRLMRDLVRYEMYGGGAARVLEDSTDPTRADYLTRFADTEGATFIRRFHQKYRNLSGPEIFDALAAERRLGHQRLAWAFRVVAPDAGLDLFSDFVRRHAVDESLSDATLADLYRRTDPADRPLSDLGYLARIHPLELWVASFALHEPDATLSEYLEESRDARIEVYRWLFRTGRRDAQDQRIRTVLEMEAFQRIHRRWVAVGYPFQSLVPSLGTSIGSSGDRPLALAELAGIILNGGVRQPVVSVQKIRVGEGTPFETRWERRHRDGDRVLSPEVADALHRALLDVVASGTGRRVRGAMRDTTGTALEIGGKTGTGDNRFRVFAPGGQLVSSRAVNRTSTFVFVAGDRYFGVIVAYVDGPEAERYRFTSALPTQLLRVLGPRLEGLEGARAADEEDGGG